MWRRLLNSAALVTITHRRLERVSNRIDTQVGAQMIDKRKTKMTQRELYNGRDPPGEGRERKRRENTVAPLLIFVSNCDQSIER